MQAKIVRALSTQDMIRSVCVRRGAHSTEPVSVVINSSDLRYVYYLHAEHGTVGPEYQDGKSRCRSGSS